MGKTGLLAVFVGGILAVAVGVRGYPTKTAPFVHCSPENMISAPDGSLRCAAEGGGNLSAAQKLGLGGKLRLNVMTEEELALLPGIGPKLAHSLVSARPDGGFADWEQVNAVSGIGNSKLGLLQKATNLR